MYRLVLEKDGGLIIGINQYDEESAEKRILELSKMGIIMVAMEEKELFS